MHESGCFSPLTVGMVLTPSHRFGQSESKACIIRAVLAWNMTIFEDAKPRSGIAEAKRREREISKSVQKLMEKRNEEEFVAGLEQDFGIKREDPRYEQILTTWREQHPHD